MKINDSRKFNPLIPFCLILVLIHLWIDRRGGVVAHELLYTRWLGLSVEGLKEFRVWQLLSYSLLHGSWFHLLSNLAVIWFVGRRLVVVIGQKKTLLIYLCSVVAGGLVFASFDAFSGQARHLVGASGGSLGLFMLAATLDPGARLRYFPIKARNMSRGLMISSLCLVVLSWMDQQIGLGGLENKGWRVFLEKMFMIAHSCHLGGGLAGIVSARLILGPMMTAEKLRSLRKN